MSSGKGSNKLPTKEGLQSFIAENPDVVKQAESISAGISGGKIGFDRVCSDFN